MNTKHTPGPWIVAADGLTIKEACDSDSAFPFEIARVSDTSNTDRANAYLIASAPDLLASLRALVAACERGAWNSEANQGGHVVAARAAIARAEGTQQ